MKLDKKTYLKLKEEPLDDYNFCGNQNIETEPVIAHTTDAELTIESSALVPDHEHDELERPEPDHASLPDTWM